VRAFLAMALVVALLTACGGNTEAGADPAAARVERCVDRLLEHATPAGASEETLRRYTRETYCARFERRGWVYEDGALSIAAQTWLEEGVTCATARAGEPAQTVPCEQERPPGARELECALLRHVRKSEVVAYLERLQREGEVACDDGTPLDELGVP
jgi:hypothetical protein